MVARIQFLGAAGTVTGSRYLVEHGAQRLLVDCGLFQGLKKLRQRNWDHPGFDPKGIDAVVLTHAHIDHSGYLPRLCAMGYRGPVYCTVGTRDLLQVLLPDAGHLQEEDARRANLHHYTRHHPAEPLYTRLQAERCLEQLRPVNYGEQFRITDQSSGRFTRAGHIIGSACLHLSIGDVRITFSGDVGRPNDPIMRPPEVLANTDFLVVESTYGNRRHPGGDVTEDFADIVNETNKRGGVLLIPSFAVGRAQHVLQLIATLRAHHRIPHLPVFLDSPMAIDATEIFFEHRLEHRLTAEQCQAMGQVAKFTRTSEESKAIAELRGPVIILSASGMATGGRVLHHLQRLLGDERNTVLMVGYQAAGTRGRSLLDGTDEVKIHGDYVPVRARIAELEGLSAHADYVELIEWLRASNLSPRRVFVAHGEPAASDAFRRRLRDSFGWDVVLPDDRSSWSLD